ncbi:uncharacterized protein LOC131681531 [Topomyia yanbarensis]|uniref:uncharacterized protein LOC131681531 n=1 Tax=Topomyia yanbarensis TaxID=2498891 RepID=UPI00273BD9BC|nr:uncharacterized protein LOC131681531 [Topomyia yanbarensis]
MKLSVRPFYLFTILYFVKDVLAAVKIIEPEMYIAKLAKRFVEILETRAITGADMPIEDYTAPISLSASGIHLEGNVSFHSAFVTRIGSIELNMQRFQNILRDTEAQINAGIIWRNIGVALDFYADLVGYQGPGTLLVTYGQFELPLTTQRLFATGQVSGSCTFGSISSQNDIVIVGHPNNAHVQMIARAINTNFDFRDPMIESFRRWNFQNVLNVALSEIPFPEVCYNC